MNGETNLITKSYRSAAIAWVVAMIWCIALMKPWIGLSITLGTLLMTAVLISYDYVVRRAFVPGAAGANRALLKLALIKYPVIGLMLYLLVHWGRFNALAFCGGIVLVHFAIVCKVIGINMVERAEKRAQLGAAGTEE
jgi:hypothetical protein